MSNHKKVYLEITNRCNLSCAFCPGTERAPHTLGEEEFTLLVGTIADWAEYLYYHLMGEPTSHPLLPRFIEIATSLGLKSIITTNGTLLGRKGEEILRAKPYKINVSLHSFEANSEVRSFEEYIGDCVAFARAAANRTSRTLTKSSA